MTDEYLVGSFLKVKGAQVQANYNNTSDVLNNGGNPLIEALPVMMSRDELIQRLPKNPKLKDIGLFATENDRLSLLETTKEFYQPLEMSLNLAVSISLMLRASYRDRNPFDIAQRRHVLESLDNFDPDLYDDTGVSTSGLTLLGLSGMGKSRAVNRILSFIYQVIYHHEYKNRPFTRSQIVWLKLDCPHNGSIKALCLSFFQAVDQLLGTDYYRRSAQSGRANVNAMIAQMAVVAANHYLGVLVIDEIQNLRGSKEGTQLLNFLVQLSNEIGIPLIFVGTPSAQGVLTSAFRIARRGTGHGNFLWPNMRSQSDRGNGDWEVFVRALWRYQYVKDVNELTSKLSNTLLAVSGGITDLAIKIFIAAQRRAIATGTEKITSGLIRSVAHDEFPWTNAAVRALKINTQSALRQYEDLYFEQVKSDMPKASPPPEEAETLKPATNGNAGHSNGHRKKPPTTDGPDLQMMAPTHRNGNGSPKDHESVRGEIEPETSTTTTLMEMVAQGREQGRTAYESLQSEGLIWAVDNFLNS